MTDFPTDDAGNLAPAWGRILGEIAHDVRGAAAGVEMWLDLQDRATEEAPRARAAAEIRRALARELRLAEALTDAAALLDGAGPGAALPVDLAAAVTDARLRFGPEGRARNVEIVLEVVTGFAHAVVGDAEAWRRFLDRFLGAALVHAPGGSTLAVRLSVAPDGAGVELVAAAGALRLPPDRPLLEAWSDAGASGASFPLGLYLARAFVVAAGGRLEIRDGGEGRRLVAVIP